MIVEERIYTFQPGKVPEFLKLYEREGLAIQKRILGTMVGYFYTEVGPLNQVIHMWAYKDMVDRAKRRAKLVKNKQWQAYLAKGRGLLLHQENKILNPAPFSPTPGVLMKKK